jgi:hypothetical protein
MSESRRIEAFVKQPRLHEQSLAAPKELPGWVMVVLGAVGVAFLVVLVSLGHPTLYGFAACMVVAVVSERAFDRLGASWGGGLVVADVEPSRLWFRAQSGGLAIASLFLGAVIGASYFFVVAMVTPGFDPNRFFTAFGLLLAVGCWHGVRMIWRAVRGVELLLDAEGISVLRWGRRRATDPWDSVIGAYAERRRLVLTTTNGTMAWSTRQLLTDPVVIAEVIIRFCASERGDADFAEAIVEELIASYGSAR